MKTILYKLLLLLLFPFGSISQSLQLPLATPKNELVSPLSLELKAKGKLDSIETYISIHRNYKHRLDYFRKFYVHRDTLKLETGYYGVGCFIIDPYNEFHNLKVGQWIFYFPDGNVYASGKYEIGAYTSCEFAGYRTIGYSFKAGTWQYWCRNKQLLAQGNYQLSKEAIKNNCDTDFQTVSNPNEEWLFYSCDGELIDNSEVKKSILFDINRIIPN